MKCTLRSRMSCFKAIARVALSLLTAGHQLTISPPKFIAKSSNLFSSITQHKLLSINRPSALGAQEQTPWSVPAVQESK
uniref:Uncharacterized protein n=1 Tax=Setaria viridis TaxID=4556 RepID=A0A4U6UDH2_SETVI|nr:hypothetical protein SEVIR_5G143550v2 [Setaria viridis]